MGDAPITVAGVAASLDGVVSVSHPETVIRSVTHDSRNVTTGSLFIAITGMASDGHDFIDKAIALGASALLVDRPVDVDIAQIVVPDTRSAMPWAARAVFREPDVSLSIVGITGTNGKTTVAHLCESIWRANGWKPGLIGTLGARIDGNPVPLDRTTPEATDLQALLGSMRDAGVDAVAMEVSSHAMDLHRADAIMFSIAAFTNLSQDHLDFHGDMESYYAAKASLFEPERVRQAVINIDDTAGVRLASSVTIPVLSVGGSPDADVRVHGIVSTPRGTVFSLTHSAGDLDVEIPLIGSFNVSNAAVAGAIAIAEGIPDESIIAGLATVSTIHGRMELVEHTGEFTVVVDYAHTPDAISEVLQAAKVAANGRVIAVIGAAGDRDRDKRSLMGAAAVRFADLTVITSDNPRSEDPAQIAAEVRRGADAVPGSRSWVVLDRADAIRSAIGEAEAGDIVLILGKGHEKGIEANGTITPFDDRSEAVSALSERGLVPRP
ncbi:MAG: UDP-N-acetylmuramoyl-L-alanyl-D-glutamate--2,6-diaminopimelate ligase [Actinomycetia bacterium]|nr:UDP-N-acetylmuramoyl-L-alanyl-D-glutamate--2,6-diaminopimelate ligase [Actinomycetes bacterium]